MIELWCHIHISRRLFLCVIRIKTESRTKESRRRQRSLPLVFFILPIDQSLRESLETAATSIDCLLYQNIPRMQALFSLFCLIGYTSAFQTAPFYKTQKGPSLSLGARRRTLVEEKTFDPFAISDDPSIHHQIAGKNLNEKIIQTGVGAVGAVTAWTFLSESANAASANILSQGQLDPSTFQPVCPASDGFYRFLQSSTAAVVGPESFVEYGPLIAGGLLRVRLELCVVESFFEEAVVPFIQRNGLSWVLPLHETVETFIAGTIFALAATFILIGSTKLVSVIVFFTDLLLGAPARLFGGFFYDRALGKPVTLDLGFGPFKTRVIGPPEEDIENKIASKDKSTSDIVVIGVSGAVKYAGDFLKVSRTREGTFCICVLCVTRSWTHPSSQIVRQAFDTIDLFVGRYLVIWASGYILLKFVHFKVFPDFP